MGNANSGRRPQPTSLRMLRGNPSRGKPNQWEPTPPDGAIVKPDGLSPDASAIWDELAPVCLAMRTLTAADLRPFATMCELQATLVQASRQKSAPEFAPFTISQDYNGADKVGVHAALRLERETATAIRPYYALFGLEPISRAKIMVPKTAEEAPSKWAGVLK